MILILKRRGDWDLGLCTCGVLAKREPLRNGDFRERDVFRLQKTSKFGIAQLSVPFAGLFAGGAQPCKMPHEEPRTKNYPAKIQTRTPKFLPGSSLRRFLPGHIMTEMSSNKIWPNKNYDWNVSYLGDVQLSGESHKYTSALNIFMRAYSRSQCHQKYPQHRHCSAVSRRSRLWPSEHSISVPECRIEERTVVPRLWKAGRLFSAREYAE